MSTQPLSITEDAVGKIIEIRDGEESEHELALFIEITGIKGPQFVYELSFMPVSDQKDTDERYEYGELSVLIPKKDTENLDGATLSLGSDPANPALAIDNPNQPATPLMNTDSIPGDLVGPLADKVQQVIERQVNP
ncbi:MAG: hypothetical protein OEM40_08435, partial [Acidimicrobiia bacterium]|nr:hypothetical protein [Acidimicrobiia bacterium]